MVSASDSPLMTDDLSALTTVTSPPHLFMAASKEVEVLVEGS